MKGKEERVWSSEGHVSGLTKRIIQTVKKTVDGGEVEVVLGLVSCQKKIWKSKDGNKTGNSLSSD
jgi:hypothetical protein